MSPLPEGQAIAALVHALISLVIGVLSAVTCQLGPLKNKPFLALQLMRVVLELGTTIAISLVLAQAQGPILASNAGLKITWLIWVGLISSPFCEVSYPPDLLEFANT